MKLNIIIECTDADELYYQISTAFAGLYDSIDRIKMEESEDSQINLILDKENLQNIINEILGELDRALKKFPDWPDDPLHALAVLGEEYGELTKEMLQSIYGKKINIEKIRTEAFQVAAMTLRLLLSLDIYDYKRVSQHIQK